MKKVSLIIGVSVSTLLLFGCINAQKIKNQQKATIEKAYETTKGNFVWEKNRADFDAFINYKIPEIKKIDGLFWLPPEESYTGYGNGLQGISEKCFDYKYVSKEGYLVKGNFRLPTNTELRGLNKYLKKNPSSHFPAGYYYSTYKPLKIDPQKTGGFTRETEYYSCVCDPVLENTFSFFDIVSMDIGKEINLSSVDRVSILKKSFDLKYGSPVIEKTKYDDTTGRMTISIASTKTDNLLENCLKKPAEQNYLSQFVFYVVGVYHFKNESLIHLKFKNKLNSDRRKTSIRDLMKNYKTRYVFIGGRRIKPGSKPQWKDFEGQDLYIGTDKLSPGTHKIQFKFDYPNKDTAIMIMINETTNNDYSDGLEYLLSKKPLFRTSIELPVERKYAKILQKKLNSNGFSPKVAFDVNGTDLKATGIVQLDKYKELTEKHAFDMAYSSIKDLNAFVEKFHESTLVDKAKLRILELSNNSISKLKAYIKNYPGDKYCARANKRINRLAELQRIKKMQQEELRKDNAYGDIIGSPNVLKGAKFINGRIWQDVPLNSKIKHMDFYEAKKYAENLNLLGIKGWRLPSEEDFLRLGKDMDKLEYVASQKRYFTDYFTRDVGCEERGLLPISREDCVIAADISTNSQPYISKNNKNRKASVRCVLSTYKYNKHMRAVAQDAVNKNNFQGYLDAFIAVGDKTYIKRAYSLAKTRDQKEAIEFALIQYFGFNNVFKITGKLNGNKNDGSEQSDFNKMLITAVTSSGKAFLDYDLKVKKDGTVPLKYGRYALTVMFELNLKYSISAMGIGTSEREKIKSIKTINLTPENGWKASGRIDFGQVVQAQKGNVVIFDVSRNLTEVKPLITFKKIEVLK